MKEIVKFINEIPAFINAEEPEQFRYFLNKAYEDELSKATRVFDRETDRFNIIRRRKVKSIKGWLNKRHVLRLLWIMNTQHKIKELPNSERKKVSKKLDREVRRADAKTTNISMNGTLARASYWG